MAYLELFVVATIICGAVVALYLHTRKAAKTLQQSATDSSPCSKGCAGCCEVEPHDQATCHEEKTAEASVEEL